MSIRVVAIVSERVIHNAYTLERLSESVCVCVTAGGIQSAVAAVSPGGFPMLIQRPGSIPPEIIAAEQQRRASAASQLQHMTPASLATRVRTLLIASHTSTTIV